MKDIILINLGLNLIHYYLPKKKKINGDISVTSQISRKEEKIFYYKLYE